MNPSAAQTNLRCIGSWYNSLSILTEIKHAHAVGHSSLGFVVRCDLEWRSFKNARLKLTPLLAVGCLRWVSMLIMWHFIGSRNGDDLPLINWNLILLRRKGLQELSWIPSRTCSYCKIMILNTLKPRKVWLYNAHNITVCLLFMLCFAWHGKKNENDLFGL